jgi:hypothetical protein
MSFRIQFRTLCEVHFWHDFLLARGSAEFDGLAPELRERILAGYSLGDSLRIAPTEETTDVLRRHRIQFRPRTTGFFLAGAVSESQAEAGRFTLEVPLPADCVLRFSVNILRPGFLDEANLPVSRSSVFLLSNRTGVNVNGELHLSQSIPLFSPAKAYQAGDLIRDQAPGTTVLLEAIEDVQAAAAPATGKWVELPAPRYIAEASYEVGDRVLHGGGVFAAKTSGVLPAPPAAANWTKLYDANLAAGVSKADLLRCLSRKARFPLEIPQAFVAVTVRDRDSQIVLHHVQSRRDNSPLHELQIALPSSPPGRYTLEAKAPDGTAISGLPTEFYLHPEAEAGIPLAIVELANLPGPSALFDASGHLISPQYHVRFRHRRAFWRYIFHGDLTSFAPEDLGDLVQESPADNARYATKRPLPLTAGLVTLKPFDGKRLLPNPSPSSTRREGGKLYAETFLKN